MFFKLIQGIAEYDAKYISLVAMTAIQIYIVKKGIILSAAFLCLISSAKLFAQDKETLKALEEVGLSASSFNNMLNQDNLSTNHRLSVKKSEANDTLIQEIKYLASQPIGKQWKLEKVNKRAPSQDEQKEFNRQYNSTIPKKIDRALASSIKIIENTDNTLTLEYSFDPEYIPVDIFF